MPDTATDHLIRPEHLFDGVAVEFDATIDIGAVNVFWRGDVYKLVPDYDQAGHADHLVAHPYDERFWYDPIHYFIAWRRDDDD